MIYYGQPWYYSILFWEIFFLDFISKLVFNYALKNKVYKITSFLTFEKQYNRGFAFSLGDQYYQFAHFFYSLLVFFTLVVLATYTTQEQKEGKTITGLTMMLAGGFGNLVDRLIDGSVLDFIRFSYAGYSFPVFNIADIFISVGAALTLYQWLMVEE